ncbi:hypothetical protein BgiMline_010311, partial [Biomphalaria glabrata]
LTSSHLCKGEITSQHIGNEAHVSGVRANLGPGVNGDFLSGSAPESQQLRHE